MKDKHVEVEVEPQEQEKKVIPNPCYACDVEVTRTKKGTSVLGATMINNSAAHEGHIDRDRR
jgi:hypothetical protein